MRATLNNGHVISDRPGANERGKDYLTALPNELLLRIIEQLPVREIYRLRTQIRRLQYLIDENEGALTRAVVAHRRNQLVADHIFLADIAALEATEVLKGLFQYYGTYVELGGEALDAVAWTLQCSWERSESSSVANLSPNECMDIDDRIIWLYARLDTCETQEECCLKDERLRSRADSATMLDPLHIDLRALVADPLCARPDSAREQCPMLVRPRRWLTKRCNGIRDIDEPEQDGTHSPRTAHFEMDHLRKLFDLPDHGN